MEHIERALRVVSELGGSAWNSREHPRPLGAASVIIGPLENIDSLWIINKPLSAAAVRDLGGIPTLREVLLGGCEFGADAFDALCSLPDVTHLSLHATNVTDSMMPGIVNMAGLTELTLDGTTISDGGLEPLLRLGNLDILHLSGTLITDAAFKVLGRLELSVLDVSNTQVTGQGIRHLKNIGIMMIMDFSDTKLSDKSIEAFGGREWVSLHEFLTEGTQLSPEARKRLVEEWMPFVEAE